MKYLYIDEDGSLRQGDNEPSQEDLAYAESAGTDIVRFNNGNFEAAEIDSETIEAEPAEEDEEQEDDQIVYSVKQWTIVKS